MSEIRHFYIEGSVIEVTEERARERVASGEWFICEESHLLGTSLLPDQESHVYHKNVMRPSPVWKGTRL